MRIIIIGSGVVGVATGGGFQRFGHDVLFYDIDNDSLEKLRLESFHTLDKLSGENAGSTYPSILESKRGKGEGEAADGR